MADKSVRGKFVWHDLATSDLTAAQTFYTKVLGWQTQAWDQDPNYTMFAAASGPLGGSVADSGQPHWVPYVATANLSDALNRATSLGASVIKDATPAGSGEYAILKDPQGAVFGIYAGESTAKKDAPPKRGEFSWHELATSDPEAALKFYGEVFGWETTGSHDMGPSGTYYMFGRNGQPMGGIYISQSGAAPNWLGYVRVKDVNQIAKKVKSAGGKVLNGPMEVPGGDWIVQFADPQGGALAAHTLAADLQAAKEAAAAPSTQSVPTAEVEELSSPIEGASEPAPRQARAGKAKSTKAKKKAKSAKKSAPKSAQKSAKKSTKRSAKKAAKKAAQRATKKATKKSSKAGAKKRAAAKSARGGRKSAKRAAGKKSAKKAAKKKSRGARKGK